MHSPAKAIHPSPDSLPCACRPSKENAQALSRVLGDSAPASPQGWDIEKGSPGLLNPSPDPLLRLGRLPSISESGSRKHHLMSRHLRSAIALMRKELCHIEAEECVSVKGSCRVPRRCVLPHVSCFGAVLISWDVPAGRKLPLNMPSGPIPSYVRAMSFPGHLLIPESVFGANDPLPSAQPVSKPAPRPAPKGSSVEHPVDFPPVSSSESCSDHSSGLSPKASFPQRPSSKCATIPSCLARDVRNEHNSVQARDILSLGSKGVSCH